MALVNLTWAGVYVTVTSGIRFNDVGGIRFNDVGGIRFNDVGGIRFNDVGGIRFNDVGGTLLADASGLRFNDVGGIRFNDVGGLSFDDALSTGETSLDPELLSVLSTLPDSSSIFVIVTYRVRPTADDLADLEALGIPGGTLFRQLPMVVVDATPDQIRAIAALPAVRSVWADRTLSFFDGPSRALIGDDLLDDDPELRAAGGGKLTGAGITVAVLDTGVDGTHPDLPYGSKLVENVRLVGAAGAGTGFDYPASVEGVQNTDLVLGHGTFVASVAAGSGAASGGRYEGVAPGASVLGLSAGDLFIVHVLEGFDYILQNASRFGVRVVNCSWGLEGFFDPDDPVNIATHALYDAGIVIVFAAGNHGPAPDTLNPYSVAPWVLGVGSTRVDGRLSDFSSRGIFEELLYHPALVAPGEGIVAAKPVLLPDTSGSVGVTDPSGGVSVPPTAAAYYTVASGTSFAAPHVAGVIALMLEADPSMTPAEVHRVLQRTATPMLTHRQSEVGAGRLDAWAAVASAVDAARPFGTHLAGWLDERPYTIVHRAAIEGTATLPAGGSIDIEAAPEPAALAWSFGLAWGTSPPGSDLDVLLFDAAGNEVARSESFNGLGLFGRAEGVQLLGSVPGEVTAQVTFKEGAGALDQTFSFREETAVAVLTGFTDVDGLSEGDLDVVTRAVSRHVLAGRGEQFEPAANLTRGELARALALAGGRPQRVPSQPTFSDVPAAHADYPYVESVAGARAGAVLLDPVDVDRFDPDADVRRLDVAVSTVRAAGLESEALSRTAEPLALQDADRIPFALRGYVIVALERGFIEPIAAGPHLQFRPDGKLSRLEAARFLPRLLAR